jgi:WD40 repeat protein
MPRTRPAPKKEKRGYRNKLAQKFKTLRAGGESDDAGARGSMDPEPAEEKPPLPADSSSSTSDESGDDSHETDRSSDPRSPSQSQSQDGKDEEKDRESISLDRDANEESDTTGGQESSAEPSPAVVRRSSKGKEKDSKRKKRSASTSAADSAADGAEVQNKDEPLKDEPLKDEPLIDEPLKDESLKDEPSSESEDEDPVPDRLPGKERFVSFFFSVGIHPDMKPLEVSGQFDALEQPYEGDLMELFPRETKSDPFPEHIWVFCFPTGVRLQTCADRPPRETFPFISTLVSGDKLFGQALVVYEPLDEQLLAKIDPDQKLVQGVATNSSKPVTVWAPRCLCLLSYHPFFATFRSWLSEFHQRLTNGQRLALSAEDYIIDVVMRVPLPPQRSTVEVEFAMADAKFLVSRVSSDKFDDESIPLGMLFKVLSVNNVLTVLRAILMEERVLLVSKRMTLLTFAGETLRMLIYPFAWPHVYIPILPESLLEFPAFSPMPFIIGVLASTLPKITSLRDASTEIFVVDLDNNSVTTPVPLHKFPEPEFSQLHQDMNELLFEEVQALDDPGVPVSRGMRNDKEELVHVNSHIVAAFRRFFVSMLRDYRKYLLYLRVFPEPVAMFDTEKFIAARVRALGDEAAREEEDPSMGGVSRSELRTFFEALMETQAFQVFLEAHNWPEPNMFDSMIDDRLFDVPLESLLPRISDFYAPTKERPSTFPGGEARVKKIRVRPPKRPAATSHKYDFFPKLDQAKLRPGEEVKPAAIDAADLAARKVRTTSTSTSKPVLEVTADKHIIDVVSQLLAGAEDAVEPPVSAKNAKKLISSFKNASARRDFARELTSQIAEPEVRPGSIFSGEAPKEAPKSATWPSLSAVAFDQLSTFICMCLREATSAADHLVPRDLLIPIFALHKVSLGAEVFLYGDANVRDQEQWRTLDFWEIALFSSLSSAHRARYGDIRRRMERWAGVADEKRESVAQAEEDVVFDTVSKFVFYQVHLGCPVELIRKLLSRATSWTALEREKIDLLNDMASNMISANELMTADLPDEDTQLDTFSPEGHFVLVGGRTEGNRLHGETIQAEQHEMVQDFIQGGSRTRAMNKMRERIAPLFAKGRRKTTDRWLTHNLDLREDYTVKTLRGHEQAVLSVAMPDTTPERVFTGSCDSTIRIWNTSDASSVHTLKGHTGWVNCMKVDHDKIVSGSYDRTVKLWDAVKGAKIRSLRGHEGAISALTLTSDAILHIVSGGYDNTLRVWDPRHPKKSVLTLHGHDGPVTCISAAHVRVLSGSRDNTLRLWDLRSSKTMAEMSSHSDWLTTCTMLNDDVAVSGSCDTTARVWRGLRTGDPEEIFSQVLPGHKTAVTGVTVRDSVVMTTSFDGSVRLWDLDIGHCVFDYEAHHDEITESAGFRVGEQGDGHGMFVTGSADSQAKLWNFRSDVSTPSIKHAYTLSGHRGKITSVESRDNMILTGSWDRTARLWEFDRKVV